MKAAISVGCFDFYIEAGQKCVIVLVPLYIHGCTTRERHIPLGIFARFDCDRLGKFNKRVRVDLWRVYKLKKKKKSGKLFLKNASCLNCYLTLALLFPDLWLQESLLTYGRQLQSDNELHRPCYKNELSACERLHLWQLLLRPHWLACQIKRNKWTRTTVISFWGGIDIKRILTRFSMEEMLNQYLLCVVLTAVLRSAGEIFYLWWNDYFMLFFWII